MPVGILLQSLLDPYLPLSAKDILEASDGFELQSSSVTVIWHGFIREVLAAFLAQVMFMTGWSPAKNQPKAAERGSGTISFAEFARELEEKKAKERGLAPTSSGREGSKDADA